jgi:hypothetical protein
MPALRERRGRGLSTRTRQSTRNLPIICLEADEVIIRKTFKQEATLDDGQWLRPLMAGAAEKTRLQPDAGAVARIRETVRNQIERESVSLVA